jgi:hypothetical protein
MCVELAPVSIRQRQVLHVDGNVSQALTGLCLLRLGNELQSRTVSPLRDDIWGVVIVAGRLKPASPRIKAYLRVQCCATAARRGIRGANSA